MNRFFHRLWNAGIKEEQINFFIVLVPLPDADNATVKDDSSEWIVDQFAFPTGERLIGMLGGNESIDDFALAFQVGIAIRNKIDRGLRRLEAQQRIDVGFADEKFVFGALD